MFWRLAQGSKTEPLRPITEGLSHLQVLESPEEEGGFADWLFRLMRCLGVLSLCALDPLFGAALAAGEVGCGSGFVALPS